MSNFSKFYVEIRQHSHPKRIYRVDTKNHGSFVYLLQSIGGLLPEPFLLGKVSNHSNTSLVVILVALSYEDVYLTITDEDYQCYSASQFAESFVKDSYKYLPLSGV